MQIRDHHDTEPVKARVHWLPSWALSCVQRVGDLSENDERAFTIARGGYQKEIFLIADEGNEE